MSRGKGSATADDWGSPGPDESTPGLRAYTRVALVVLVVVLAGCIAGTPITQNTETSEVCIERGGAPPSCLVEEHPTDLLASNQAEKTYNVSVRITRNDSTVVFSRNVTLHPDDSFTLEDVIDAPGSYVIHATTDAGTSDLLAQTVEKRWRGEDHIREWIVEITEGGEIDVRRYATHAYH